MKSFLSKYHLQLFFFAVALESLAANFAHPITPTLIQNLQLPDYSFGMLYAGMAFTNFLFSPFWAKQVTRMGSRRVLGICCVGYGIGQLLFAIMKTLPTIMLARLLSGFFVGGITVSYTHLDVYKRQAHVHHRIHKYQMKSLYRTMQEASESENRSRNSWLCFKVKAAAVL